jgi:hypothetical protein
LEEQRFQGLLGPLMFNLRSPRFRESWSEFRGSFDSQYMAFVDDLIAEVTEEPSDA